MGDWKSFWIGVGSSLVASFVFSVALLLWASSWRFAASPLISIIRLHRTCSSIGMSCFTRGRSDYAINGRGFCDYIRRTQRSVNLISISLASGEAFHGLTAVIRELVERRTQPVSICISLLDPNNDHLMSAIAAGLRKNSSDLANEIRNMLNELLRFRKGLSDSARPYLAIRTHKTIPSASAILIDADTIDGCIQLETKPYKAPYESSWGFELRARGSHGLYRILVKSYNDLIADGELARES